MKTCGRLSIRKRVGEGDSGWEEEPNILGGHDGGKGVSGGRGDVGMIIKSKKTTV